MDDYSKFQEIATLLGIIDSTLFTLMAMTLAGLFVLNALGSFQNKSFKTTWISVLAAIAVSTIPFWISR